MKIISRVFSLAMFCFLVASCTKGRYLEDTVKTIYIEQVPNKKIILAYEVGGDLSEKNRIVKLEIENLCGINYKVVADSVMPDRNVYLQKIIGISSFDEYFKVLAKSDAFKSHNWYSTRRYISIPIRVVAVICNNTNISDKLTDYLPMFETEYLQKQKQEKMKAENKIKKRNSNY